MSEEIGKHKGAVETLLHEKKELSRLLQIVNSQLQKHLEALEEAGVDTDQFINDIQEEGQKKQKKQRQSKRKQNNSRQRKQGRQESSSSSRASQNEQEEVEEDADELLEGEDDFSDRDFSPR